MVNINSNFFLNTTNTYPSSNLSAPCLTFADILDVIRYKRQFSLDSNLHNAGRLYFASWSGRGVTGSWRV